MVIARQLDILIVLLLVFCYTIGDTVTLAASGAERVKRPWRDCKTRHRRAGSGKAGTRHRDTGQDRDRRPVTGGCELGVPLSAQS